MVGLVKSGFVPTGSISAQTWVPLVSPESRPSLVMKSPGTMQVLLVKLADTDTAAAGPSVKAVVACSPVATSLATSRNDWPMEFAGLTYQLVVTLPLTTPSRSAVLPSATAQGVWPGPLLLPLWFRTWKTTCRRR